MPSDVVILLSTFPNHDLARATVRALVQEGLVACGNLVPGVESIYMWKGEIETSAEILAVFKTTTARAEAATRRLRALHTYEVPEIIQIPVDSGWPDYLQWVRDCVK